MLNYYRKVCSKCCYWGRRLLLLCASHVPLILYTATTPSTHVLWKCFPFTIMPYNIFLYIAKYGHMVAIHHSPPVWMYHIGFADKVFDMPSTDHTNYTWYKFRVAYEISYAYRCNNLVIHCTFFSVVQYMEQGARFRHGTGLISRNAPISCIRL